MDVLKNSFGTLIVFIIESSWYLNLIRITSFHHITITNSMAYMESTGKKIHLFFFFIKEKDYHTKFHNCQSFLASRLSSNAEPH